MKTKMTAKKLSKALLLTLMSLLLVLVMFACSGSAEAPADSQPTTVAPATVDEYDVLWADATYKEDTTVGEGDTTFYFETKVGGNSVTFTVNTDEKYVGKALLDNGIIEGDDGDYGLYVKKVNGILADYDITSTYWAFYIDGEYATTGIDLTEITDGAHYEMVYSE